MPRFAIANEKVGLDFHFERAITAGRHVANGLPIPDPEISRRHAQIFPRDGQWHVKDLESRNGVVVNGEKLQEAQLKQGDEILLGQTLLYFEPKPDVRVDKLASQWAQWNLAKIPAPSTLEKVEVTCFSITEIRELVHRWLKRRDTPPLIPYKLRSQFLEFALDLDRHSSRGGLGQSAMEFLRHRIGGQRMAVLAADPHHESMEILTRYTTQDDTNAEAAIQIDKDVARVAIAAERAVYCANCAKDYRFRHMTKEIGEYTPHSFVAAPIFTGGHYYGFLYADMPYGGGKYSFNSLMQTCIVAEMLGKCLHWLLIGRGKDHKKDEKARIA